MGNVGRSVRALTALAILISLVVAFLDARNASRTFNPVNYFSYFTILSNVLAMGLMLCQSIWPRWMERNGSIRGAITLYMTVTLLVYAFILRPLGADVGEYRVWVDFIQHTAAPVALIGDWFLFPPRRSFSFSDLGRWLIFPIAYLAYSLVRGHWFVDWYPYPFLDPRLDGGYARVSTYTVAIMVVFVGVGSLIRWWPGYAER
jgi:hypothetical protein